MKIEKFLEIIREDLELERDEKISLDTEFESLNSYDSMSKLFLITLVDEHFGIELEAEQIDSLTTIKSFMELIGVDKFEREVSVLEE